MRRSQEGSSGQRWYLPGRALRAGLALMLVVGIAAGCSDNDPTGQSTTGTLLITVTTSGLDQDGSYTIWIDDTDSYPIASGAAVELLDVPLGAYVVELRDVAVNCAVTTENPKTATVIRSFEITVNFGVACTDDGEADKPDPDPTEPVE